VDGGGRGFVGSFWGEQVMEGDPPRAHEIGPDSHNHKLSLLIALISLTYRLVTRWIRKAPALGDRG
jgi:hypothetical protein